MKDKGVYGNYELTEALMKEFVIGRENDHSKEGENHEQTVPLVIKQFEDEDSHQTLGQKRSFSQKELNTLLCQSNNCGSNM